MILDGRLVSNQIKEKLKEEINKLNIKPKVIDIQIGYNESSEVYIKSKEKACNEIGITFECRRFDETVEENVIVEEIKKINNDKTVNAILIQAPIPSKYNTKTLIDTINPDKDIDGLTTTNIGRLVNDSPSFVPCTPLGIMELLKYYNINVEGKNVVIVGRSFLVGMPLFHLMLKSNATVTICHSKTKNLEEQTKKADILIVSVGKKHLVNFDMVKEGSIVIDVGITKENGRIYGDVDFENVKEIANHITPVPGGVGPMTVAMFLSNIVKSYKNQQL